MEADGAERGKRRGEIWVTRFFGGGGAGGVEFRPDRRCLLIVRDQVLWSLGC